MTDPVKWREIPIFDQVMSDFLLSEREVQIWRACSRLLDVVDFREVKLQELEHATRPRPELPGLSRSTLSVSVARLCALGYLIRTRTAAHQPWQYRIPLSRARVVDPGDGPTADAPGPRRPRRHRSGMVSRGV